MASTCSTCKRRKVKCDGQKPICGSCSGRNSSAPCDYNLSRQSQPPSTALARGDACLPCRRKKKKCNGERPVCRTCIIAKKTDGCVYNNDSIPQLITTLVERNRELEKLLGTSRWSQSPPTPTHTTAVLPVGICDIEMESLSNHDTTWSGRLSIDTMSSSLFDSIGSDLTVFDHLSPSKGVPSDPGTFLAPVDATSTETISQLASPTHDEFFELRDIFLRHGIVLGQSFVRERLQALHLGDVSCTIIHPALVHVVQLFGARISNRSRLEVAFVNEEQHLANTLMLLTILPVSISEAIAHIQCYSLLALHYMKRRDISTGRDWLLRADSLVRQFDLHIAPPQNHAHRLATGHDDYRFSNLIALDEEEEHRDALCQLLYIDTVCAFRMQLPTLVCSRLGREFSALMQHYSTHMKDASMVVIRMASVALLQEAHTALVNDGLPMPSQNIPISTSSQTIRQIYLYLADLSEMTASASRHGSNDPNYLMLKQCTLVAVTALGTFYHSSCSSHPDARRKCLDSISEMVSISDSLSPEDCSQLDPIISACWSIALRILLQIHLENGEKEKSQDKHGVHVVQVPTFIKALHDCASKVRWDSPLAGGTPIEQ